MGINALLSNSIGSGNRDKGSKIAGNSIFLGVCTYIVFLVFGILGVNAYINSQTNDPDICKMAVPYLKICTVFSFGVPVATVYNT